MAKQNNVDITTSLLSLNVRRKKLDINQIFKEHIMRKNCNILFIIYCLFCSSAHAQDHLEKSLYELKEIFYGFNEFNDPQFDNADYMLSLIKQAQMVNEKVASLLEEKILAYGKLNYDIALYKKTLHKLRYDDTGFNLDKANTEKDSRELYLKYIASGSVVIAKNKNLDFDSYSQGMKKNYTFDAKDLLIFYYLKGTDYEKFATIMPLAL